VGVLIGLRGAGSGARHQAAGTGGRRGKVAAQAGNLHVELSALAIGVIDISQGAWIFVIPRALIRV